MKALVKTRPEAGLDLMEVPDPHPGPGEVLVRVRAASICGTDLHIMQWDEWSGQNVLPPRIIGHEFSGYVVECGEGVKDLRPGDRVCAETHIPCGHCLQCRTGDLHLCKYTRLFGIHVDGAFAELAVLPRICAWKIPEGLSDEEGALLEPLGVAVHALLVEAVAGRSVALFGSGPIGMLAAAVARVCGAGPIFAIDPVEERRAMAMKMGATHTWDPVEENVVEGILEKTQGVGVDVVIELSGSPQAYQDAFCVLRKGGRISLVGIARGPICLDVTKELVFKGARCYGISGRRMFETWTTMSALLKTGTLDLSSVITHCFPMNEFEDAMKEALRGKAGKIILLP